MTSGLELSVTLTPPPMEDDRGEVLASIALRCDALGLSHSGDLLKDPLTSQERRDLRWYLEEYWQWPYEQFRERGKRVEHLLPTIGKRLYDAVFGTVKADRILQAWRLKESASRQISIVSSIPAVLSLPWELLHDEQGFLVLRTRQPVSLIRRLPQQESAARSTRFESPLRILLVIARPEETGFVDPRSTARELFHEMKEQIEAGTIIIEVLRPPTLQALRHRLEDETRPVHLLHFDGHGTFGESGIHQDERFKSDGEQGKLAFEDNENRLALVEASELAQVLQDSGVHLAVLDACQSALGSADDAFSSVAARLIQGGVDAVIAMSASVLVASSTRYMGAFYRELAQGTAVPVAHERARQALHDDPRRHRQRRQQDEEGSMVTLRDWWLPHYYQQRGPASLQPGEQNKAREESRPRMSGGFPIMPRYDFHGRARELLRIERLLRRGKVVVIHGYGGVGKTALACEAADWLTRTNMYHGACWVSFEHGGDAAVLLSALGHYLGVYDGHYVPTETKQALARLKPVLEKKSILVLVDNLESILPNGEVPLAPLERATLWDTLLDLTKMGAGILLTSRDTAFDDGRLAAGSLTAHLRLEGLHPDDAYSLASRVLTDLDIERARMPYIELRALLAQLDYHPLAIQLVLPTLRERPLITIHTELADLLLTFSDDTTRGRNRSLLASLDYSLRRLNSEQRTLLSRLAVFEGGASEGYLLLITRDLFGVWGDLRPILERAALLTAEQIHEQISPFYLETNAGLVPYIREDDPFFGFGHFLHFHPVLTPYLRWRAGAAVTPELLQRYAQHYADMAGRLEQLDSLDPLPARALVRRELPNLRHALEILLQNGEGETAANMARCIAYFLTSFGRTRERDYLLRQVEDAIPSVSPASTGEELLTVFNREIDATEDQRRQGNIQAAFRRLTALLARIQAQPEGTEVGPDSLYHCRVLYKLATCLQDIGKYSAAEEYWRKALAIVDALVRVRPEDDNIRYFHATTLSGLGGVLTLQGQYGLAQQMYKRALTEFVSVQDAFGQLMTRGNLGNLALEQRDYKQARTHFQYALEQSQKLGDLPYQAAAWFQLGQIAHDQQDWKEAERCYRQSLIYREQSGGSVVEMAAIYNQLALVARYTGHSDDAEGWYKEGLQRLERVDSSSILYASCLNNLAELLVSEVRDRRADPARLVEARAYTEQALRIKEQPGVSGDSWTTLSVLASIADLQGNPEKALGYRQQERESFAASPANRNEMQQNSAPFIEFLAEVAGQEALVQEQMGDALQQEGLNKCMCAALKRLWAGERDWRALTSELNRNDALLILLVLGALSSSSK